MITHLLDHTGTIFRPTVTYGAVREEIRTLVEVGSVRCAVRRPRALLGDTGAGVGPIGERVIYMDPEVDVAERDVIRLDTGPDTGTFEVDGPPTRPRGHHVELRCRHWVGEIP